MFADMFKNALDEMTPIVLDDSLVAFQELVTVLLRYVAKISLQSCRLEGSGYNLDINRPFDSCLERTHPSSLNFKKLLLLVHITHKYCMSALESRAVTILSELVNTDNTLRSHLQESSKQPLVPIISLGRSEESDRLSPNDALSLATISQLEDVRVGVETLIVADIWAGKISPYHGLQIGEHECNDKIIGPACYKLMETNPNVSHAKDMPMLTKSRSEAIERARLGFHQDWETYTLKWARMDVTEIYREPGISGINDLRHRLYLTMDSDVFLATAWKLIAESRRPPYDLLGRLCIMKDAAIQSMRCVVTVNQTDCLCFREWPE